MSEVATAAAAEVGRPVQLDMDRIVKVYVKIRDYKAEIDKAHKAEMDRLTAQQDELKAVLLAHMHASNQKQMGTTSGTAYLAESIQCSASDWAVFYDWIKEHDGFDMLEQRIARSRVKKYMDDNGGRLPPGVSVFKEVDVKIRRS